VLTACSTWLIGSSEQTSVVAAFGLLLVCGALVAAGFGLAAWLLEELFIQPGATKPVTSTAATTTTTPTTMLVINVLLLFCGADGTGG
jgi:uncharacterized membrane protein